MTEARCVAILTDDPLLQDSAYARAGSFTGAAGEVLLAPGDLPTLWVGCGDPGPLTTEVVREAFGAAGRALGHLATVEVDTTALGGAAFAAAASLGLRLGAYRHDVHLSGGRRRPTVWTNPLAGEAWNSALADRICAARDAVNAPGNLMPPAELARLCVEVGEQAGLQVHVRDETWLAEQGAGGILAIGRSSAQRPLMVEIVHAGDGKPAPDLCLVGKGVTFDTGGLSLKPADGMITMQHDMASVAAILHAMALLPTVAPNLHVRAFCPLVENMIGPGAARPGDIVTSRNGRTIEILNTDFEGRVILADALAFAGETNPALLVDVATLTYGAVLALGPRMAALFGDDQACALVEAAARTADEPVWRLPLQDYLAAKNRSRSADIRNFPVLPEARATTAALFLREFVPAGIPWAHLDIAGPAWSTEDHGSVTQGATGFGVQLLTRLFCGLPDRCVLDPSEGTGAIR